MNENLLGNAKRQAMRRTMESREQKLPEGWTEASPGGLATNPDPLTGGIIDRAIVDGTWFVVFHRDDLKLLEGLPSRESAFDAFREAINGL
ncbi:hypothetical protein ACUXAV_004994 [Cupriavidus metallidurans]|jgi:hypothetical protein|uniref:hypothetical protein n=1 Tax=Cupriavidus TaxID=106589 RepID=UPI0004933118|nr:MULTISPECIES: hypothetical protein [Cupriavidus]MDE4922625.1 hypothetical protein [Cupriavidus metallidurans]GMG94737.1 hypothetical protein Cmtc_59570 [Cupriavidus sp. TKC]